MHHTTTTEQIMMAIVNHKEIIEMNKPRHYIDTLDFSKEELLDMLTTIRMIKEADEQGATPKLLQDASLAMLFEQPSTRTRISFEVGMTELGGHALYLKPGEIHLGTRETLSDTVEVLSRMCDAIMARTNEHQIILDIAAYATVPVFNAMTVYNHPTQVLCDVFTVTEHMPKGKKLEDLTVAFIGDASEKACVNTSLLHIAAKLGMNHIVAAPKVFQVPDKEIELTEKSFKESGGSFRMTEDVVDAVKEADFVYTDVWWYHGYDDEKEERAAILSPTYQVNAKLMSQAPQHCKVLHCLPANRDYELASEVMDSAQSIVFDQAENRLHTEKGLLVWFIYPRLKRPSEELVKFHADRIQAYLDTKL